MPAIVEEEPYIAIVSDDQLAYTCSYCFRLAKSLTEPFVEMKRCAKCKLLFYCSKECQTKDWSLHKLECRIISNNRDPTHLLRSSPVEMFQFRIAGRMIIKSIVRDGKRVVAFNGQTLDDLKDRSDGMSETPLKTNHMMVTLLQTHFQKVGVDLKRAEIKSLIGKATTNKLVITYDDKFVGYGVYLGLSAHCHSCVPNARIVTQGRKKMIRGQKGTTTDYDIKWTIPYVELDFDTMYRRMVLKEWAFFDCNCDGCTDPDRNARWRALRCPKCKNGACLLYTDREKLTCEKCGAENPNNCDQGFAANMKIVNFVTEKFERSSAALLRAVKLYRELSLTLSPSENMNLARLALTIVKAAACLHRKDIIEQFINKFAHVYTKFLDGTGDVEIVHAELLRFGAAVYTNSTLPDFKNRLYFRGLIDRLHAAYGDWKHYDPIVVEISKTFDHGVLDRVLVRLRQMAVTMPAAMGIHEVLEEWAAVSQD